jgi:CrcB protein
MGELGIYGVVFVGGGLGTLLRYAVNKASLTIGASHVPTGTFLVNVTGCFLAGILMGLFVYRWDVSTDTTRLFLITGFCGGYTTFSAFSIDTVMLWERGEHLLCIAYVGGSLVLSLASAFGGLAAAKAAST